MENKDLISTKPSCKKFFSPDSTFGFEVYPEFGAQLNKLVLRSGKNTINILKSFATDAARKSDRYFTNTILFPFINRLEDGLWKIGQRELQFPINEPEYSNSIHGFIYRQPFEVIKQESHEKEVSVTLLHKYSGEYNYYPFPFEFVIQYSILKGNEFSLYVEIKNTGGEKLPFTFGWHPYFDLSESVDELEIQFPAESLIEVDSRFLPTGYKQANHCISMGTLIGNQIFDNCYKLIPGAVRNISLTNKEAGFRIVVEQDQTFDHTQVFIPPGRKIIAIEPLTAGLFAVKNGDGIIHLAPDESYKGAISVKLQNL